MPTTAVRFAQSRDIRFLAETMYESMVPGTGRGIFDIALTETGTDPISFHEALLRTGASNWGPLDRYLILEDSDGRPLGAAGSFLASGEDRRPLTAEGLEAAAASLGWSAETTRSFWRAYVSVFGLFGRAPQLDHPCDYVIEYAAMAPAFRGGGRYAELLRAHVALAQAQGHTAVGHTAMFGNDAVLRALTKFGFEERLRFGPERYRGHFPGLVRLVYDIGTAERP